MAISHVFSMDFTGWQPILPASGTSEDARFFSAEAAKGDYQVAVLAPANMASAQVFVRLNGVQIKKKWLQREENQLLLFDFALLHDQFRVDIAGPAAGLRIFCSRLPGRKPRPSPSLFILGDSTASTYPADRAPMAGWGQVIGRFFKPEVHIYNRAVNGRSTKLAYEEGLLNGVLTDIRPGDYVCIQFAHNDEVPAKTGRYVTVAEYKQYVSCYIEGVLDRGGVPVCITSMNRRAQNTETGLFKSTFPAYTEAMKQTAAAHQVPLLDLNKKSLDCYNSLGWEGTASLFMQLIPGESPNYPEGVHDNTHFKEAGAKQMARMIAEEMQIKIPALGSCMWPAASVLFEVCTDAATLPERNQIEKMIQLGVMTGDNGVFHPDQTVDTPSYRQMLHTLSKAALPEDTGGTTLTSESAAQLAFHCYMQHKQLPAELLFRNEPVPSPVDFFWPVFPPSPSASMTKKATAVLLYKLYSLLQQ